MVKQETEDDLRLFLDVLTNRQRGRHEPNLRDLSSGALLAGGKKRGEFELVWKRVIKDADVRRVIKQMLFIPSTTPDAVQGLVLLSILDYLQGKPTRITLYPDIVETHAKIEAVKVETESEGPTYSVEYSFLDKQGSRRRHKAEFGYDIAHASWNGWDRKALDEYWKVGTSLPCHYRAADPDRHAICKP